MALPVLLSVVRILRKLALVELRVGPAEREQLLMRALLDDVAVIHHQDKVGVHDGREPVRDHKARTALRERLHGLHDRALGTRVHARGAGFASSTRAMVKSWR